MYAACIISDVILEKSKNRGATNIFALLKQMINSKPYHSCLPNPLNLSSLSSLVLWSACNNRPVSRSGSSSDPLNSPAAALPSWLASLAEPTTLSLPVSLPYVPCSVTQLAQLLLHFPTCLRCLLSCLVTHMLIFQVSLCFPLCVPVHRDLFYSLQRLSRHWSKVFIIYAAPEIPALSISFNFSCYLSFFSLSSYSILCPCWLLSITTARG